MRSAANTNPARGRVQGMDGVLPPQCLAALQSAQADTKQACKTSAGSVPMCICKYIKQQHHVRSEVTRWPHARHPKKSCW